MHVENDLVSPYMYTIYVALHQSSSDRQNNSIRKRLKVIRWGSTNVSPG